MVAVSSRKGSLQIVLTPNRSASWRFNCTPLKLFGVVIFAIAIGWSLMGVWIILPFAGIEFALLVYFVYRTSQACYRKEVLYLDTDQISVERGRRSPVSKSDYSRLSCVFVKQNSNHFWTAAAVNLCSGGRSERIGRFLNREDIEKLWSLIASSGVKHREQGTVRIKAADPFGL